MRSRIAICAACAFAVAGVVSACGGSSDNGVAAKGAGAIVSASGAAMNGVKSVHISGSLRSAGMPITLDLDLVAGRGATGSMSENGLSFRLVAIGNVVYINGSDAFWAHFGGTAAPQLFKGKWLKASATGSDFSSLGSLTNLHLLVTKLLVSHGKLAKGGTSTVDGQKVVAVNDVTGGGTLYVATTGKPYPIELLKTGTQGGHITFDRFNESVSLSAPANAIDLSQLKG